MADIEGREGILLSDPLHIIKPHNFTLLILAAEYFAIGMGLWQALRTPSELMLFGTTCGFIMLLRMLTLVAVPLAPPAGSIPLRDPVVGFCTGGAQYQLNDLFFSGHTAFCFINSYFVRSKRQKTCIVLLSISIGIMLIIQRVHYTADIVFAFAACVAAMYLVQKLLNRLRRNQTPS